MIVLFYQLKTSLTCEHLKDSFRHYINQELFTLMLFLNSRGLQLEQAKLDPNDLFDILI